MNKFLLIILLLMCFFYFLLSKKQEKYLNLNNGEKILSNEIVDKINEKTTKINSINSKLSIKQGVFSIKGFIAYEKTNNFKMICDSYFGKELEIGSNNDFLWFYTRKMKPKALYYCRLEEVEKTRLKAMFYPELLREFLGIHEIKKYIKIIKKDEYYYVENNINVGKENFNKITIIKDNKIIGYRLCKNYKIILEVNIVEFQLKNTIEIPKIIKINYLEESINQEWTLEKTEINSNFSEWDMPQYKQKINLVDY